MPVTTTIYREQSLIWRYFGNSSPPSVWGIMKELAVLWVRCKSSQRITPHLNLLIKTTIRKRWQKYTICLLKDQFSLLTFGSNYIASRHLTCYLIEISVILYYNITESFID